MWVGAWVCATEFIEAPDLLVARDTDNCELLNVGAWD